jgi:aquaporin Z
VSIGLWAGGRFPAADILRYLIVQVIGAIVAGGVLDVIASGSASFDPAGGFAANGYGTHSPRGYSLGAALLIEIVLTAFFLIVILGATDPRAPAGFGPLAIGLALTLIIMISIPVTNTSVNPARSTGVAVFAGGWALGQLWLFWVAPIIGGLLGGAIHRWLRGEQLPTSEAHGRRPLPQAWRGRSVLQRRAGQPGARSPKLGVASPRLAIRT